MQENHLKNNNTLYRWGVFFPAGYVKPEKVQKGISNVVDELGVPLIYNIPKKPQGMFARNINDLQQEWNFFSHKQNLDFLIAARGGVGSIRISHLLKIGKIQPQVPVLVGFSDLTALFWTLFEQFDIPSIYGPVVGYHFFEISKWKTQKQFFELLQGKNILGLSEYSVSFLHQGKQETCDGYLIPACFSILAETVSFKNYNKRFILVLEDINEKAYQIIRYLYLLEYKNFIQNCTAIILGNFTNNDNDGLIEEEFKSLAKKYDITLIKNFPFGHHLDSLNLPFGVPAQLNIQQKTLKWNNLKA